MRSSHPHDVYARDRMTAMHRRAGQHRRLTAARAPLPGPLTRLLRAVRRTVRARRAPAPVVAPGTSEA